MLPGVLRDTRRGIGQMSSTRRGLHVGHISSARRGSVKLSDTRRDIDRVGSTRRRSVWLRDTRRGIERVGSTRRNSDQLVIPAGIMVECE